jgi:hypothetical protein
LMISCNIIFLWYWWFPAIYVQRYIDDFLQYSFTMILVISCNIYSRWYWWFPAIFIHRDTDDILQYSFTVILMISRNIPSLSYWWFPAIFLHFTRKCRRNKNIDTVHYSVRQLSRPAPT